MDKGPAVAPEPAARGVSEKDLDELVAQLLPRYDFDESGTLNSQEELQQLTYNVLFNLAVKAGVPMNDPSLSAVAVEAACNSFDPPLSETNELPIDEYKAWLRASFPRTGLL